MLRHEHPHETWFRYNRIHRKSRLFVGIRENEEDYPMDPNKRPEDMERITTPAQAQAFIAEQVEAIQTGWRPKDCFGTFRRRGFVRRSGTAH